MGRFPPTTGRRPTPIPPVDVTVQSLENVSVIAPGEVNSGASIVVSNVSQAQTLSVPFVAPDSILSVDNAVNAQTLSEPQVLPFTGITVHKVYNAQMLSIPIIVPVIEGDEFTNFDGSFHTDPSRRVVRWGASPDGNVAGRVYRAPIGHVVRSVQFVGAATGGTLDFVGGNADDAEGVSLLAAPLTEAGITTLIVGRAAWYAPVMTDMAGIECYLFFERE